MSDDDLGLSNVEQERREWNRAHYGRPPSYDVGALVDRLIAEHARKYPLQASDLRRPRA